MKRLLLSLLALCALTVLTVQAQESFSEDVDRLIDYHQGLVALENVTLFDGTGAAALTDQTVIINAGTIQEVGSSSTLNVPEGAIRVDLKRAYRDPRVGWASQPHVLHNKPAQHPAELLGTDALPGFGCYDYSHDRKRSSILRNQPASFYREW